MSVSHTNGAIAAEAVNKAMQVCEEGLGLDLGILGEKLVELVLRCEQIIRRASSSTVCECRIPYLVLLRLLCANPILDVGACAISYSPRGQGIASFDIYLTYRYTYIQN